MGVLALIRYLAWECGFDFDSKMKAYLRYPPFSRHLLKCDWIVPKCALGDKKLSRWPGPLKQGDDALPPKGYRLQIVQATVPSYLSNHVEQTSSLKICMCPYTGERGGVRCKVCYGVKGPTGEAEMLDTWIHSWKWHWVVTVSADGSMAWHLCNQTAGGSADGMWMLAVQSVLEVEELRCY